MQVASMFNMPVGQQVLRILKEMFGVEHTLEPAEEVFLRTGVYNPIDPFLAAKRSGRRDAYYLIKNSIARGNAQLKLRAAELLETEDQDAGT